MKLVHSTMIAVMVASIHTNWSWAQNQTLVSADAAAQTTAAHPPPEPTHEPEPVHEEPHPEPVHEEPAPEPVHYDPQPEPVHYEPQPEPTHEPVHEDPRPEPTHEPVHEDPRPEPTHEPVHEAPRPEPTHDPVHQDPRPEPTHDPVHEAPQPEPTHDPVHEDPRPVPTHEPVHHNPHPVPTHEPVHHDPHPAPTHDPVHEDPNSGHHDVDHTPVSIHDHHYDGRHWDHPRFDRPVYQWNWVYVGEVTCSAEDSQGNTYPVTESEYNGSVYQDYMSAIEDAALDLCYDESGGDTSCSLVGCVPGTNTEGQDPTTVDPYPTTIDPTPVATPDPVPTPAPDPLSTLTFDELLQIPAAGIGNINADDAAMSFEVGSMREVDFIRVHLKIQQVHTFIFTWRTDVWEGDVPLEAMSLAPYSNTQVVIDFQKAGNFELDFSNTYQFDLTVSLNMDLLSKYVPLDQLQQINNATGEATLGD